MLANEVDIVDDKENLFILILLTPQMRFYKYLLFIFNMFQRFGNILVIHTEAS